VPISTVLEKFGHFLFKWGWDHHVQSWLAYHQMLLDPRIYVGWGFQRFSRYLITSLIGRQDHPVWWWPKYHQMLLDTRIYIVKGWRS
jgi:hypothetical protein